MSTLIIISVQLLLVQQQALYALSLEMYSATEVRIYVSAADKAHLTQQVSQSIQRIFHLLNSLSHATERTEKVKQKSSLIEYLWCRHWNTMRTQYRQHADLCQQFLYQDPPLGEITRTQEVANFFTAMRKAFETSSAAFELEGLPDARYLFDYFRDLRPACQSMPSLVRKDRLTDILLEEYQARLASIFKKEGKPGQLNRFCSSFP